MIKKSILVFILSFFLSGCPQEDTSDTKLKETNLVNEEPEIKKPSTQENSKPKMTNLPHKGTVHYLQMEGGFYGIITDKGEKLLPLNLDKQYLSPGAVIHFSGSYVKDMMTIQQWGTPFKIKEVKLIKAGDKSANPEF